MNVYNELKNLKFVSWPVLLFGLEMEIISKKDIEDYAMDLLNKNNTYLNILLLADASRYDIEDLKVMLLEQIKKETFNNKEELDKLKLAAMVSIDSSIFSEEKKCEMLQEVYAMFDYPEDMLDCSIYSQSSVPPLQAMNILVKKLKQKFFIPS
jgi:hypothetical protein